MKPTASSATAPAPLPTDDGRGSVPSRSRPRTRLEERLPRYLRWLIAIRIVVITSFVLPYLLSQLASPTALPTFDFLFLLAGFTYVVSLGYIALLRLLRGRPVAQAYIQFGGDLAVVTGLVYYFGGIGSPFSLFYLVVIMAAAAILYRRAALVVATAAYILYGTLISGLAHGRIPTSGPTLSPSEMAWRVPYNLAVHLFGFYAVALLASLLTESVRRAEAELAEKRDSLANLEVFHRDVVQSISTGLATTDLAGRITSINRAALEILGMSEQSLLGQPIESLGLFPRAEWDRLAERATADGRTLRTEAAVRRGDETIPVGYNLSALTDAAGVPTGCILLFQDLSQWHRLEQELRLKDRMAAVGELAAGIAHELGNPLAAISGSVQLLSQAPPDVPSQRKLLEIILRESQRLDRTIKGFLRFTRPRERAVAGFDVAELLRESCDLLRNSDEATGAHRFELDLDPPVAEIQGDRDQISQIFWNLARNSLRAMPDGGTLSIRGRIEGELYRIVFRDTGHGMTDEQRARLFQPFRSFFDSGTGIGMAIVYRIVQDHGGRLEVASGPGRGTAISVELPVRIVAAMPAAAGV